MLAERCCLMLIAFSLPSSKMESVRDYVARFKSITMEVYNLDIPVAILAMKRGLHLSCFTYSLYKKPPRFYAELLLHA